MRLDPRTLLLSTVMLISATFLASAPLSLAGVAALCLCAFFATAASIRRYVRNLLLLSWLLAFTLAAHLWGAEMLSDTSLMQRLSEGMLAVGQLSVVVGWVTILSLHSSPLRLLTGLERLLQPLRRIGVPVAQVSLIAMLSLRFLPILFDERQNVLHAYIARGQDAHEGSLPTRLKHYILICGPLFSSLLRRVEHIARAMESRAFSAQAARTSFYELRLSLLDFAVLGVSFGVLLLVFALRE